MVAIFSTGKTKHQKIVSITDNKLKEFDISLNKFIKFSKKVVQMVKVHQNLLQ